MGVYLKIMIIRKLLDYLIHELNDLENPKLNAEMIISHVLLMNRLDIYLHMNDEITKTQLTSILKFTSYRKKHKPLQYILGETEFYGYKILVNNSVLIPRPETELLVENIINEEKNIEKILEIGTGSGAIAVALAKNLNAVNINATDISERALETAKHNAKINNVNIIFFYSDIFEQISDKFDLIVSNPPYISKNVYDKLPIEIRDFEPKSALFAEENGLYFYNKILSKAKEYLTKTGIIYFEIGYDQAEKITEIAKENNFGNIRVFKDLNEFDRIVRISR